MPRIPPTLFHHARRLGRPLPSLLPVCGDLSSSRNELRWLAEHAAKVASKHGISDEKRLLQGYVSRRARGEPLQYILGTEFFGDLEIKCRPGVLIPRQETAASVSHLAKLLLQSWERRAPAQPLNVLDLCTGTGCIPLLLQHELSRQPGVKPYLGRIVGVDVSPQALRLAEENKAAQLHAQQQVCDLSTPAELNALHDMQFIQADVFADEASATSVVSKLRQTYQMWPTYDVLISNPPYISSSAFRTTTAASVRRYEPKLALVPPHWPDDHIIQDGDAFYPELYHIARRVNSKVVLFEVADMAQACRVAAMAGQHWKVVEIWRDDPEAFVSSTEHVAIGSKYHPSVRVKGTGNGRSVVAYSDERVDGYISGFPS